MNETPPLRRNVRFQMLWIGSAVSGLGSSLTWLAFPLLLLAVTGSPALAGLAAACRTGAKIVSSVPAGVLIDRLDRRRILLASEATRCVAMATLAVAIAVDRVWLPHIIAVAIVIGVADAFFGPAHATAVRAVVPAAQLPAAYAQEESREHAASLVGPPLGGLLFGLGRVLPFLVDAVTYAISVLTIVLADVPRRPAVQQSPKRSTVRGDIADAGRWLWRQHGLRDALSLSLFANLVASSLLIPVVVVVGDRGGDSTTTGVVLAGLGIGGLLGAMLSARIGRLLPAGKLMLAVVTFFAFAVCSVTLPVGRYWPVVPLTLAMVAVPAINVALQVIVATTVPEDMMGRLVALLGVVSMGLAPLGPVLGGSLAEYIGGTRALLLLGAALAAACALAGLSPALRALAVPPATPQTHESAATAHNTSSERSPLPERQ
ncbi:MFS transporter [Virgisporangium ochraceum]|uniref:MFS transporter n=1 Tax=Virgisporangium ochraceum TaxID=65505 RepID=A0A8J3ZSX2_9ACTN|nr:MFS transporter [Virgisporangium ochraceum]GIJ68448.1 MFS transporter [Virgisporangium ochraceum]